MRGIVRDDLYALSRRPALLQTESEIYRHHFTSEIRHQTLSARVVACADS
jgi:hypothetical protein